MSLDLRLAAYEPNGARLGVLPTPQTVQCSAVLDDVGAIQAPYPTTGPRSGWLTGPAEIAVELSYDDGQTWTEPDNMRFLRLTRSGDQVKRPDTITYAGPSYAWRLSKADVLPEGKLNADGKRPFLSATAGAILRTLAQEAQARGALEGMDFTTFDEHADSAGRPWSRIVTLYYEPGITYQAVLQNLADQGLVDFATRGRSLLLFDADGQMAGPSGVTLHAGRDLAEAPYQATLEGLSNFVFLMGDNGVTFTRTNPEAQAPWGRWESYISQGGVSDVGTMTVLTDATLETAARERIENTYGLNFGRTKHLPFRDYQLGQDVNVNVRQGVPVPLRLRQVTLTRDDKGVLTGNVVLNDRFLEAEVRQARRVTGITGGATLDGGTGARPISDSTTDTSVPAAPGQPIGSSVAYLDDEGKTFAQVTLTWPDVTENDDGTACTDLDSYEPAWRLMGDTAWSPLPSVSAATTYASGFQPNTRYQFAVTAKDTSGHRSQLSPIGDVLTAYDATAPERPSAPDVTPYLGQLLMAWDGLNDLGGAAPTDFARTEFHLSQSSGFTPDASTFVDATTSRTGGATVATGLVYGATYYAALVMVDRSGNRSPKSVEASGVPPKAAPGDISAVTANQITAGAISAAITITGRLATSLTGQRVEVNAAGIQQFDANGVLAVEIAPGGSTFSGTLRTAPSGPRAELVADLGQSALNFYTGVISETEPGQVVTTVEGSGATANATIWLVAPVKDGLTPAYLNLSSRDADTGADMFAGIYNGSVYWESDIGWGAHFFGDTQHGRDPAYRWLNIRRDTSTGPGAYNAVIESGAGREIAVRSDTRIEITGNRVEIYGLLRHNAIPGVAGNLVLTDPYGNTRIYGHDDGGGECILSDVIYNRTTTGSANMVVGAGHVIQRSTSLARYKDGIDRAWGETADLGALLGLKATSYYDAGQLERYALAADPDRETPPELALEYPRRYVGLIAEDVQALGLDELCTYDEDGNLAGVNYDRIAVALLPVLQDHARRLTAVESRA